MVQNKFDQHLENQKLENEEEILQACVYREGDKRTLHAFVVVRTLRNFYSFERNEITVVIQRAAAHIHIVIFHFKGKQRKGFLQETDWEPGKGTIGEIGHYKHNKILNHKYIIVSFAMVKLWLHKY